MKIATHNGPFHCDDVFAVAVLLKLYPDAEIVRTRDTEVMDVCDIVLDVGQIYDHDKKRYDHHQLGKAGERENGISYSALGLVWRHYGLEWCEDNKDLWQKIDGGFVTAIDADDNGQELYTLTEFEIGPIALWDVIKWFRPMYGEAFSFDEGFMRAVEFATTVLLRYKTKCLAGLSLLQKVSVLYLEQPDKRAFVMEEHMPLGEFAEEATELLFTVYPDANHNWRISTVPKEKGTFKNRKDLPESWAGLSGEALADVTGVEDAVFCHNERFIAGAKTKEGVLKLLKLALEA